MYGWKSRLDIQLQLRKIFSSAHLITSKKMCELEVDMSCDITRRNLFVS